MLSPSLSPHQTIFSLGKKYQFRVVAVTKAGESEPSQETKPHLCRYKNLSPCIDQGSGGSKMVKLNRMATFQIKVRGEPRATFTWLKEGQKLSSSEGKSRLPPVQCYYRETTQGS